MVDNQFPPTPIELPQRTMKRHFAFLLAVLFTGLSAVAEQKTVNIVTVNNPDMITLKKLSTKFEAANPDIKLNWLVLEENIMRQRITTDVSTGGGQFDVIFIGLYEAPDLCQAWLAQANGEYSRPNTTSRMFSSRCATDSLTTGSCMRCLSTERARC